MVLKNTSQNSKTEIKGSGKKPGGEEIEEKGPLEEPDELDPGSDGQALQMIMQAVQQMTERLDYLENRKEAGDVAKLYIANRMFNTDPNHLRELTIVPLRGVKSLANSDTVGSILMPAVQSGDVTLAQVWKESHHRYMRSVKGNLLEKGKELALEEARQSEGPEDYDQAALGDGL